MFLNNENEKMNQKYNFLTELKMVKSSSYSKLNKKFKLIKLNENFKKRAKSRSRSSSIEYNKKKINKKIKNKDDVKKKTNFEYKFKILFGKIFVKKKYLKELVKRKKIYSEKVKKIKLIKRNESMIPKED